MENATGAQIYLTENRMVIQTALPTSEEDTFYHQRQALMLFSAVSYSITFLLGVSGNGLVIWISTFKMTRTVTVTWFLNLAIADFIFDVFLPIHIVPLTMDEHWPFGNVVCKISHTVLSLNMVASITFLVIISIDRCLSVLCPIWSRNHRTPKLALKVSLGAWLLAVIFSSPYPAFYNISTYDSEHTYCFQSFAVRVEDFSWEEYDLLSMRESVMAITRFTSMFLVPFVIIIICYGAIALKIKKRKHQATSSRPFKIIITIMVLFFVCWFPFHTFPFLELYEIHSHSMYLFSMIVRELATCLAYFNSCLNPILYVFMGRDFKDTFRKSFLSVFERAFTEEPSLAKLDSRNSSKSTNEVESHLL